MAGWSPDAAARWIAEAVETGNPLASLPEDIAPRDVTQGAEIAAGVLAKLEIAPCGLRLLRRPGTAPLAGPMVEGRLLPGGAAVALDAMRHPWVTAAVVGVLAAPLEPGGDGPPVLARLHPAIDVSATRFTAPPQDAATLAADLARLGFVVAGRGKAVAPGVVKVALAPKAARPSGVPVDLAAAFAEAAAVARDWGGLPAGALLVVAGLTPPAPAEGLLRVRLGALGGAEAAFG
jgi:hypothetical protein